MKRKKHHVYVRRGFQPARERAVFLDRDGTINVEKHLVYKLKDFELIAGAGEAIGKLNRRDIPVVVYHNASVVARGLCDEKQVLKLHEKLRRLLAREGAYVDVILYCPHHPQAINPKYEYDCDWRKPKRFWLGPVMPVKILYTRLDPVGV
jgi:histidinol-phosphate phosphatase family protein